MNGKDSQSPRVSYLRLSSDTPEIVLSQRFIDMYPLPIFSLSCYTNTQRLLFCNDTRVPMRAITCKNRYCVSNNLTKVHSDIMGEVYEVQ